LAKQKNRMEVKTIVVGILIAFAIIVVIGIVIVVVQTAIVSNQIETIDPIKETPDRDTCQWDDYLNKMVC
jgi:hypothetical protein